MQIREATPNDIPQIQVIRNAVKENRLSDPALVTDKDCYDYIMHRGKGWVCELDGIIVGFAIADLLKKNIWALFVDPVYEGRGIGRQLHNTMMDWYFSQDNATAWLSTAFNTRAERFYEKAGWIRTGNYSEKEVKFELSRNDWQSLKIKSS